MNIKKNLTPYLIMACGIFTSINCTAENTTFNKVCESCHTGGFKGWITGAPEIGDKNDWAEFIEKDSLEDMANIVINGKNDHKIKGGCKKCSDEDIKGAIKYMVSTVQIFLK